VFTISLAEPDIDRGNKEALMSFIKLYPLVELEQVSDADFGKGNPARCHAQRRFGARECYLNVAQILAFEECPLYLICEAESDALVDGIRLKLVSGEMVVVPDDADNDEARFLSLLERASKGEPVEMPYSQYMQELEKQRLI
jgi:hypothetical protein